MDMELLKVRYTRAQRAVFAYPRSLKARFTAGEVIRLFFTHSGGPISCHEQKGMGR